MTSVESWASPKHFDNFTMVVFNGTDNLSYFNFTMKLLVEIKKSVYSFNLKVKTNESRKDYDIDVLSSSLDSCQVAKGVFGNFIIKFFMANLEKYSNFKIECPQKQGFFYAYNFPVPLDFKSYIPSFIPVRSCFWQLTVTSRAKLSKNKAADMSARVQMRGEFINTS